MTTITYKLKSNNRTVATYTEPDLAHQAALDLQDRTNEAVTVDPDPLHDLRDFARDFPVNFQLACGYTAAELGWIPLPFVSMTDLFGKELEQFSEGVKEYFRDNPQLFKVG